MALTQFAVPQHIDVEDKILGPITTRQFIIGLVGSALEFVLFKALNFWVFLLIGIPFGGFIAILAFYRVNGQPFHFFLLNLIQTLRRPRLKVWDKTLTDGEVRMFMKEAPERKAPPPLSKAPIEATRLQELALVVNTGGVYRPEE